MYMYLEHTTIFFPFRLSTILNQIDNLDEADSEEDIDSYTESSEVLGNDEETASADEWVINRSYPTDIIAAMLDDC